MNHNSAALHEDESVEPEIPAINEITLDHPWQWLAASWEDLRRAKEVSLAYGTLIVVASYIVTLSAFSSDFFFLVPPLAAGFFLVAPLLAFGLYDISRRLESGESPGFREALSAWRRNPVNLAAMGLVLMMAMLAWMLAANIVFALFYSGVTPTFENFIPAVFLSGNSPLFLAAGILSGGVIAGAVFCISVISVPMLMERDTDVQTAVLTSVRAVRKNPRPMLLWACLILMFGVIGIFTFYIGLLVSMPLLGFASWHAYRDLVQ